MSKQEREHLIEWLVTFTGYNRSYFDRMEDDRIEGMYNEFVGGKK